MKNLKKYTKAELISKINGLNKNNSSNLFSKIIGFFLLFKNFMLKITLIAIIIKIFKKYSIFRRLWTIFNTILLTIFGISFIDMFQIEILSNLLHNILDLFSKFQENLLELFSPKVDLPTKSESLRTIQQTTTRIQDGNDESNKIIERFKQIINKKEEIIQIEPEFTKEEIQKDTPFYKNKYIIIGGILILSGLTWYFYDDLKPIGSSVLAWINHYRSRPDIDPNDNSGSMQGNSKSTLQSLKDSLSKRFFGKDKGDDGFIDKASENSSPKGDIQTMDLTNKGKSIDFNNLSQSELTRRNLLDQPTTGLIDIIGNFKEESSAVLAEIDTFVKYLETSSFPKTAIQIGLYNLLRERLLKLSELAPIQYNNWLYNDSVNQKIENFLNIESEVFDDQLPSPEYDAVTLAAIQERDVWSDRANTPSAQSILLSPLNKEILEPNKNTDLDIFKAIGETLAEDLSLTIETINPKVEVEQQEINVENNSSSNSSLDHYFPKSNPNLEIKIEETNQPIELIKDRPKLPVDILSQINSKRLEYGTPNIGNIGLQTPIQERLSPAPLINKPSISNLLEDSMNLFDNNPLDMGIDTSPEPADKKVIENPIDIIDSFDKVKVVIDRSNHQLNFNFGEMKNQIRKIHTSTNDGYLASFDLTDNDTYPWDTRGDQNYSHGTRIREILITDIKGNNISIYSDNLNPSFDKSNEFVEGSSNDTQQVEIANPWLDVEIKYEKGDIYKRFISIDLHNVKDQTNKVLIITNDGRSQYFKPMFKNNSSQLEIKWDNLGLTNPYHDELDIQNVYLIDKNNNNHNIFYNKNVKILDSFFENIKK